MKKLLLLLIIPFLSFGQQQTYVPDDVFEQALIDLGYDDNPFLNDSVPTANISTVTNLSLSGNVQNGGNFGIQDLTGIEDFTYLEYLQVSNNELTFVDISQNQYLDQVRVSGNQITEFIFSENNGTYLEMIYCGDNLLTDIDISILPNLKYFDVSENLLTEIDISNNLALETLMIEDNQLFELDVSNNDLLDVLWCHQNELDCIQVGDVDYANTMSATIWSSGQYHFRKDANAYYSLDCGYPVYGCTDFNACNFNANATEDNGTCDFDFCVGCTDATACNYSALATLNDGSCFYPEEGYDCSGNCYDADNDGICNADEVLGCTDELACNYNADATDDDNSCLVPPLGYNCDCIDDVSDSLSPLTCAQAIELFGCGDSPYGNLSEICPFTCSSCVIYGCMDEMACNYNTLANTDDNSCWYAESGLDCDGNCLIDTIYVTDTLYIDNFITDTIIQTEYITDTIVETEYVEVIITEYIDCDTGLPCTSGMAEIIEKSKTNGKLYNLLGQEIFRREGIYIEGGEIKYRLQ